MRALFPWVFLLLGCGARTPLHELDAEPVSTALTVRQISVGPAHACAVRSDGVVLCWGAGLHGELGDGARVDRTRPVQVEEIGSAVEVAAGGAHTCARLGDGSLRCWGSHTTGQLGDGIPLIGSTAPYFTTPAAVRSVGGATAIAAGSAHTCALSGGAAFCFGINDTGELGDDALERSSVARRVVGVSDATTLSAGISHTCVRTSAGSVLCWGSNDDRQLGASSGASTCGPYACARHALTADDVTGAKDVALAGNRTCVIFEDGTVSCFGLFPDQTHPKPAKIAGLGDVVQLSLGGTHNCALRRDGVVLCWGGANRGQLGREVDTPCPKGSSVCDMVPRPVPGLANVKQIAAGGDTTCALLAGGEVRCFGRNDHGQLGDGTTEDRATPAPVVF